MIKKLSDFFACRQLTPARLAVLLIIALPCVTSVIWGCVSLVSWLFLGPMVALYYAIKAGEVISIYLAVGFILSPVFIVFHSVAERIWPWMRWDHLLIIANVEAIILCIVAISIG